MKGFLLILVALGFLALTASHWRPKAEASQERAPASLALPVVEQ